MTSLYKHVINLPIRIYARVVTHIDSDQLLSTHDHELLHSRTTDVKFQAKLTKQQNIFFIVFALYAFQGFTAALIRMSH